MQKTQMATGQIVLIGHGSALMKPLVLLYRLLGTQGNLKDVTVLLRYLADGWEDVQVDLSVCDVNRDGTVDLRDVTVLRRFLAGGWGIQII